MQTADAFISSSFGKPPMLDVVQTVTRLPTRRCAQSLRVTQVFGISGRRLRGTNASHGAPAPWILASGIEEIYEGYAILLPPLPEFARLFPFLIMTRIS